MTAEPRYCEVRTIRALDITDNMVIRKCDGAPWRQWREVMGVYRSLDELDATFSRDYIMEAMPSVWAKAAKLLDLTEDFYVGVQVVVQEKCTGAEIEDDWLWLYRFELVEVQTLPAWSREEDKK